MVSRRRSVFGLSLAVAVVWCLTVAAAAAEPAARPNVLLVMTDQQHAGMMSCAGNRWLRTPAMDGLAARGVRFERAYCANPVCIPSRFSMMTGAMPSAVGMDHNGNPPRTVPQPILNNALGNLFRAAGYETLYGGKVHLPGVGQGSKAYGFDQLTADERDGLADACGAFFRREHRRPFLLVASFINPHDICYMAIDAHARAQGTPPLYPKSARERECLAEALRLPPGVGREEFFAKHCPPLPANFEIPSGEPPAVRKSDRRSFRTYVKEHWTAEDWRLHRWAYARLTERVDGQIGRVLAALRAAGLEESTLVVFVSDHGDMDAAHRAEHKSMCYEEATRVPLILCGKGVAAAGRVDKTHLVSTGLDLIPTLCDFAGLAIPAELKGRSLRPLTTAADASPPWRECLMGENEGSRILWTSRYKYAVYDREARQEFLVDLQKNPGETDNLADDDAFQAILQRHRALLEECRKGP